MLTRSFDDDTALEPAGDGTWSGHVPSTWFIASGPNGGFLAALATRAMMLATGRSPRSLTLHYLRAPDEGPITVRCAIEREGRTTAYTAVRFEQDGRAVGLGLGAAADRVEGQPEYDDTTPPRLPPPDECERVDPDRTNAPEFTRNYDTRFVRPEKPPRPAVVEGWMRSAKPRPLDPILIAAMTDAFIPPAFIRMEQIVFVPTVDLTIHWRAQPPEGEHPWVLGRFTSRLAEGGVCEEDGELWSEDGRLLAHSRQLAILRRPR